MERQILHLVIPAFPIALARTADASLRGRPVAVAPLHSERALLQCVSEEAEDEGVAMGTPLFRARRICPGLIVLPSDPAALARGNAELVRLSAEFTPVVEPAAGRVFLDLTGSGRLFGPARDVGMKLEKRISDRLGLEARAGSGINKLVTRVAADLLPEPGVYDVHRGSERSFLAPFPVSVLPGVGEERQGILLRDLNLRRVADVASLSIPQLRLAVGTFAALLHERACGIDRSPVSPPRRSGGVMEEALLAQEEHDDDVLLAEVCRLAEECGLRVRRLLGSVRRMTLKVTYADGVSTERSATLPLPCTLDSSLFPAAEDLFLRTCTRRVRVRSLRLSCETASAPQQPELFATRASAGETRSAALQETLDGLRDRFGRNSVHWGRTVSAPRRRQEDILPAGPSPDLKEHRYSTLTRRAR